MTGAHEYEMEKRFAVVKRDGDVVGKFDQRGGGTIFVGREEDSIGDTLMVEESADRSHIEVTLDTREDWFVDP